MKARDADNETQRQLLYLSVTVQYSSIYATANNYRVDQKVCHYQHNKNSY